MKFFGNVGYCYNREGSGERKGIVEDVVEERQHYGDVLSNSRRWSTNQNESVLDTLTVSNRISIVADEFAMANFGHIKYVRWMDQNWKVESVEVARPRLILQIGGLYNGPTPET